MERLFYMPSRAKTPAPLWLEPRAEAIWFTSADGTGLRGWFIPAAGADPRTAPSIVHVHGNAGSLNDHLAFVDFLPAAGVNVLSFDYRGYGESEGSAWSRAPLVEDTLAALAALRGRADIDPSRIALYGVSLGGAIAIVAAARDAATGGALGALLLESPFACWRDVAANALGGDPAWAPVRGIASWLIPAERDGVPRPVDAIAQLGIPILIIHGDADTIVPVSHGRRLAEAAPAATLLELRGAQHNSLQATHPQARRAMVEFLHRALVPRAATTASEAQGEGQ